MNKIVAVCCFRNAADYLPEFISHLEPYIDGFLFLDDGRHAADQESGSLAMKSEKTLGLICRYAMNDAPFAYETRNRALLLREALAEGATSVVCLDADERVSLSTLRMFRQADKSQSPLIAWARNLWDTPLQFRVDGVWGQKRKCILFPKLLVELECSHPVTVNRLHQPWAGWPEKLLTTGEVFHLGGMTAEQRAERVRRHEAADPDHKWQADYKYLADEKGLQIARIPIGGGWQ